MRRSTCLRFSLALGALAVASQAAAAPIPVDAFVEPPQFSTARLSPDGKHVAVNVRILRDGSKIPTMTIYSLPDMHVVSTIILPHREVPVDFSWVSNERLIVEKGYEPGERERPMRTGEVVSVEIDGSKQEYLYGYQNLQQSRRGDRYGKDEGWGNIEHISRSLDARIFLAAHEWSRKRSVLYEINAGNAVRKMLATIPYKDMSFVFQHNSRPRFSYGEDDDNQPVLYRADDASGEWRKVEADKLGKRFHPFAFTHDDSEVYASVSERGEPYALVRENMSTGKRTPVASDPLGDITRMEYSAWPYIPFAVATDTGIPKPHYIDADAPDAMLHQVLSAQFPGAYVHFINFTNDGQKLLFSVRSDRDPGAYYLFDRPSSKALLLFANMPAIDPELMASRLPISFKARDGLAMTGYLTLPRNSAGKKAPMVLMPHGGPFGVADDWFFDEDAQFLASRGYAVLQVNFRGSGGRGDSFMQAGYREWGGKIMDDLADGVKWAGARPDIDPQRVCVYGGSFGGYAALMLPVREPAMFKCSVGYAGRYDLTVKYDEEGIKDDIQAINFLDKTLGRDPQVLAANSPTRLAEQIKLPVLLVHGSSDKTTNLAQAEAMRDALTKAGRPPEWMMVKKEGHGFYDSEHRKEFYLKLEAFLAKHLGPI